MLDAQQHSRIIANSEYVCTTAGIRSHFLNESMTKYCGPKETEWVRKFWQYKEQGIPGLVLEGVARPDTRCQVMAAALVRNYIDARVIAVNTLLDSSPMPSPSVLLIPNLYLSALSKSISAWRVQALYDALLDRAIKGKPSVVYVEDLKSLVSVYGAPFKDFLGSFVIVQD